jgi:glycosyltransferase involved in cell wall biosynthesis
MSLETHPDRHLPNRWQALLFQAKAKLFQLNRTLRELGTLPPRHPAGASLRTAGIAAEKRSPLWRDVTAPEFPLTAGKVENLRHAASAFHGVEVPAGATFSFWRQLGRTSRSRGFTSGRELREGCMVPAIGGGLCQLSGLIYQAALEAGLTVVERHAHSRILPGSAAEQNLDATVFWNYVDLRFRSDAAWRIEVELTTADLVVRIRTRDSGAAKAEPAKSAEPAQPRAAPSGDCLTCGMISCFRHPSATAAHAAALGHSAFLLDAQWPEFDAWCREHSREGDVWLLPLDARRWNKPNYAWSPPHQAGIRYATTTTLLRSFRQRRLPNQGALRQKTLLEGEAALARRYAAMLDPLCRHIVVSQNLLPYLWQTGALGGRSFDVLMVRQPMEDLQKRLDTAARSHPDSPTLADFRAAETLIIAEREALAAAGRLVTPHRELAKRFGSRAWLLDWQMPETAKASSAPAVRFFLPCSPLARKGIHELAAALRGMDAELLVLGGAGEGANEPLKGLRWRRAGLDEMLTATAVVLPAWVEHQPRVALRALAAGIPVVATAACGLPDHPHLYLIADPASPSLPGILRALAQPDLACAASSSFS